MHTASGSPARAAQLERIVRGIRRVQRIDEVEADPEEAAYRMRTRHRYDADGNLVVTIYAPAEDAPVILAGLAAQRAELDRRREACAAESAVQPADVPAATSEDEQITDVDTSPDAEPAPQPVGVPAGTPAPIREAFPEVTPQAIQNAIANCQDFVTRLTNDSAERRARRHSGRRHPRGDAG